MTRVKVRGFNLDVLYIIYIDSKHCPLSASVCFLTLMVTVHSTVSQPCSPRTVTLGFFLLCFVLFVLLGFFLPKYGDRVRCGEGGGGERARIINKSLSITHKV